MVEPIEKVKTALLWSIAPDHPAHGSLAELVPVVEHMFPGTEYYGPGGLLAVMREIVRPTVTTIFKELVECPTASAAREKFGWEVTLPVIKPSRGPEWRSKKWQAELQQQLILASLFS